MHADSDTGSEAEAPPKNGPEPAEPPAEAGDAARDGEAAGDGDLARLERGLKNLAFVVERDRKTVRETMDGLRAELERLNVRIEAASAEELDEIRRGVRELGKQVEHDRKSLDTRIAELRKQLGQAGRSRDIVAIRRQLTKLDEMLIEVRDSNQKRRLFGRSRAVPATEKPGAAAPGDEPGPVAAPEDEPSPAAPESAAPPETGRG